MSQQVTSTDCTGKPRPTANKIKKMLWREEMISISNAKLGQVLGNTIDAKLPSALFIFYHVCPPRPQRICLHSRRHPSQTQMNNQRPTIFFQFFQSFSFGLQRTHSEHNWSKRKNRHSLKFHVSRCFWVLESCRLLAVDGEDKYILMFLVLRRGVVEKGMHIVHNTRVQHKLQAASL